MMYLSLYKMHELALHGFWKVDARYRGENDYPAHGAAREAALTVAALATACEPARGRYVKAKAE